MHRVKVAGPPAIFYQWLVHNFKGGRIKGLRAKSSAEPFVSVKRGKAPQKTGLWGTIRTVLLI